MNLFKQEAILLLKTFVVSTFIFIFGVVLLGKIIIPQVWGLTGVVSVQTA